MVHHHNSQYTVFFLKSVKCAKSILKNVHTENHCVGLFVYNLTHLHFLKWKTKYEKLHEKSSFDLTDFDGSPHAKARVQWLSEGGLKSVQQRHGLRDAVEGQDAGLVIQVDTYPR